MMFNSLSFITSISLAVSAVRCAVPPTFVLVAHAPGTPLDGKPVNANNLALWVGKPTSSGCPEEVLPPGACPPGDKTVLAISADPAVPCSKDAVCGSAGMSVAVPGGQRIYLDAALGLRITIPHSGFIPAGSSVSNFSLTDKGLFGWNAKDPCTATFGACTIIPDPEERLVEGFVGNAYQIYGLKDGEIHHRNTFGKERCVTNVRLIATPFQGAGAWEYL